MKIKGVEVSEGDLVELSLTKYRPIFVGYFKEIHGFRRKLFAYNFALCHSLLFDKEKWYFPSDIYTLGKYEDIEEIIVLKKANQRAVSIDIS